MLGKRTCIVLGAGASRGYTNGSSVMPLQSDIIGRLFMGLTATGLAEEPDLLTDGGLRHSRRLGEYLRARFGLADLWPEGSALEYWRTLQDAGHTLESLYAELEGDPTAEPWVTEEFGALVRNAVISPVKSDRGGVCSNHARLCEVLDPGDYIVNFNWDSLMADALYHQSNLWFPATGFGVSDVGVVCNSWQRQLSVGSLVTLLHVHGAVVLFEVEPQAEGETSSLIFVQPDAYNASSGVLDLLRIREPASPQHQPSDEERRRYRRGAIHLQGRWLLPLFVPPSTKKSFQHRYYDRVRRVIHTALPSTQQFIVVGYSFPSADTDSIRRLFVPDVLRTDATLTSVNPANVDETYKARVASAFPTISTKLYAPDDFASFVATLNWRMTD